MTNTLNILLNVYSTIYIIENPKYCGVEEVDMSQILLCGLELDLEFSFVCFLLKWPEVKRRSVAATEQLKVAFLVGVFCERTLRRPLPSSRGLCPVCSVFCLAGSVPQLMSHT